jgi:hypothetical protein
MFQISEPGARQRRAPVGKQRAGRTERGDELLVVRDNDDRAGPVADADGEPAERLAVEEVARLVEHAHLVHVLARQPLRTARHTHTCGLFHRQAAMTSLIFCPAARSA